MLNIPIQLEQKEQTNNLSSNKKPVLNHGVMYSLKNVFEKSAEGRQELPGPPVGSR